MILQKLANYIDFTFLHVLSKVQYIKFSFQNLGNGREDKNRRIPIDYFYGSYEIEKKFKFYQNIS